MMYNDSIVALATPSGAGAISIIRVSGQNAIEIGASVFKSIKNKLDSGEYRKEKLAEFA